MKRGYHDENDAVLRGRHEETFEELRERCIDAFSKFQSDAMTLDYCEVEGKARALLTSDPEYKRRTKQIKAQKYLEEIDEIEKIAKTLEKLEGEYGKEKPYDVRDEFPDSNQSPLKDFTSSLNLRFKAAELRRQLLALNQEDAAEESDALNVFLVPVTREEFEKLRQVEISLGTTDGDDTWAEEENAALVGFAKEVHELDETLEDSAEPDGEYIINEDGEVVEL
jgi:hypothetical protein